MTAALRVKGHRLETVSTRGGLIAECSCGSTLSPAGTRGQTGRSVRLGIFVSHTAREAARQAHEAHKAGVLAARS